MKSEQRGRRTSAVEVTNVSRHGFWLLLGDRELFLAFEKFPWFRDAPIAKLVRVQQPSSHHLYWPGFSGRPHAGAAEPERYANKRPARAAAERDSAVYTVHVKRDRPAAAVARHGARWDAALGQ